jgi:hypothetical protein
MTDDNKPQQQLTTTTRQAEAIDGRSAKLTVTGKLARAIGFMVWEGARRQDAAEKACLKDHSLRAALKKPHVLRHYHAELGVLRESTRAKNFHRLDVIAGGEGGNDMAKVAAIKTMEAISDQHVVGPAGIGGRARAGYLIDLGDDQQKPGLVIYIEPVGRSAIRHTRCGRPPAGCSPSSLLQNRQ